MILPSPKTKFATELIDLLKESDKLAPYVLPTVFSDRDQYQAIRANATKFGGCVAVSPMLISSTQDDPSVRDAWLTCDYLVLAIVDAAAWRRQADVAHDIATASDWIDALLGAAVPIITGWQRYHLPDYYPVIVSEQDVALPPSNFAGCLARGLVVRARLSYHQ